MVPQTQQKNSYYQLVSIFTPLASPDSESASSSSPPPATTTATSATTTANPFQPPPPPPEQQHDLTPAEIDRICKLEIDRLFDVVEQTPPVPYPDTPLFRRLAKLELQQQQERHCALVVKEQENTPIDEQQSNKHCCVAPPVQEVEQQAQPSTADDDVESAACLSTAQVVLSQIEEVLTDEDKDSSVSDEGLQPDSFSDCADDEE